jgi:hypothetical protein
MGDRAAPKVRAVGSVTTIDGLTLSVGVDYDTVTIRANAAGPARLTSALAGDFAQLFTAACWEASAQRALMDASDLTTRESK